MNTQYDDGGPAFPVPANQEYSGMTLRDWFAGMAMQGLLAANAQCHDAVTDKNVDAVIAREAYLSADAMLAERARSLSK